MIPASDLKRPGFTRKGLPVLFPEPGEKFPPLRTYDLRLRDGSTRSFRTRSLNDVFSLLERVAIDSPRPIVLSAGGAECLGWPRSRAGRPRPGRLTR